tara:strand:+ start:1412 stop:2893 length:1482 start_codon:yes stop_codon:yes gene_type:complete
LTKIYKPEHLTNNTYRCEYLVIGSGAGGSVAALELAEAGKDVIIIEEGQYHKTSTFSSKISDMMKKTWRNHGVTPFWGIPPIGFAEGKCLGGSTVINGGLLWRTPRRILNIWEREYGLSGYSEDNLLRHFEKVEELLNVGFHREDNQNRDSEMLKIGCDSLSWKYLSVPRAGGGNCINSNLCPTGCPSGAKQSTALTYLPTAVKLGARIFTGSKAIFINNGGETAHVIKVQNQLNNHISNIKSDYIFLSGGAIQTPFLLQKSKIKTDAGKKLEFHFNLKFVAEFDRKIESQKGTIFTIQVQEYMDQGLLIMASNYQPHYLAMTLEHFGNNTINDVMERYEYCGLFVAQVQAKSKGKILSISDESPFVSYNLNINDIPSLKNAIKKTTKLLFASGAKKVFLPIRDTKPINDPGSSLEKTIDNLNPRKLEIVSVHAMASCSMGGEPESITDLNGKVNGLKNIHVTDASVLPSNIGESPQGTIMAMSHEILSRHLN